MRQDALWDYHYQRITDFINTNKRRPSKYRDDERQMVYWIKYCKKLLKQGKMSDSRKEKFEKLLNLASKFQRKNQYEYSNKNEETLKLWKDDSIFTILKR